MKSYENGAKYGLELGLKTLKNETRKINKHLYARSGNRKRW